MPPQKRFLQLDGMQAYLCGPADGSRTGVLLLPMMYGIDPVVQGFAERLAEAGLTALVWDPYPGQTPSDPLKGLSDLVYTLKDGPSLRDQRRWLDYMEADLHLSRLGVIGWCTGGRFSLLLAAQDHRLKVCVSYYPSIKDPLPDNMDLDAFTEAKAIRCPVQLLYGTRDVVTPRHNFEKLRKSLEERDAATFSLLHPQADHGFLDEPHHPGEANLAAAGLAWPQTLALLLTCLASD